MIDVDLNLLTNLAALLQTRSVSQAAQRRRMSQPAMSRSLAELRRLFGDPLLVRTRGGMLLTRRAEELAEPLQTWLDEAARLIAPPAVDPWTLARRFRVGATEYGVQSVLRPALPAILAAAPGVAVDIRPAAHAAARLAGGEIDLLVSGVEPDRRLVHERHLFSEPFLCVARVGHPLALAAVDGSLRLDDVMAWPHVGVSGDDGIDPLDRALAGRGAGWRTVASTPYVSALRDLLLASDAVSVLPRRAAREQLAGGGLQLFGAPPEIGRFDHWLIWHTRSHRDPALQWLIALIAEHCRDDGEGALLEAAE